jgi:hypothetical protein
MADQPPLHDYSRSHAVLMGTWDYAFLGSVPAAENSLRRMAALLSGPLCGWPRERLLLVENEPGPGDLPDRIITAFDGVTDVALFYFVGHGQITPDDQLCLGLVQSRPDANRRAATSLRFSDVRQALNDSDAAFKILILDCCFAGLAATTGNLAGLDGDVLDLTGGADAYTLAATSAYATAWYETSPGLARPQTYFTKYLADLVEEGIPGQPSRLQLDVLYRQLRDNLAADKRPFPGAAPSMTRGFVFAYNAAPQQTHHDPEQELARLHQQITGLETQVGELTRELARFKDPADGTRPRSADAESQLQSAIDEATRQLADARAEEASLESQRDQQAVPVRARTGWLAAALRRPLILGLGVIAIGLAGAGIIAYIAASAGDQALITSPPPGSALNNSLSIQPVSVHCEFSRPNLPFPFARGRLIGLAEPATSTPPLPSGMTDYIYAGSDDGSHPLTAISWQEDKSVSTPNLGNKSISIGQSTSSTGSFNANGTTNAAIAGLGVAGYHVIGVHPASRTFNGTPPLISVAFTTGPGDLSIVAVGGQGAGLPQPGAEFSTLVNDTYSECGSDVIASAAIFAAYLSAGYHTASFSGISYNTNKVSAFAAVAYVLAPDH